LSQDRYVCQQHPTKPLKILRYCIGTYVKVEVLQALSGVGTREQHA